MSTPAAGPRRAIVHLAAECFPHARTGGLAEAVHGLAAAQAAAGEQVHVVMPLHRSVRAADDAHPAGEPFDVVVGPRAEWARLWRVGRSDAPTIWAIEHEGFFGRDAIYGGPDGDYPDNPRRFAYFCHAALQAIAAQHDGPVVLHLHDWHTALAALFLRESSRHRALSQRARAILTVHNPGYQGHFSPNVLPDLGIPWSLFTWEHLEWYGKVNFLKGGLTYADRVFTVSPSQAAELLTPTGGFGLYEIFQALGPRFGGIINGIDQRIWDPAHDPQIVAAFGADDPAGKTACKAAAQDRFGLPRRADVPLFAFVGRLVQQKGLSLVLESPHLLQQDAQFVFLGQGESRFAEGIRSLAERLPDRISLHYGFRDELEHTIIAGADALLMPSQYEPCGLTQMRAQRYGTLPIVRRVGGLADTVSDGETGFAFDAFSTEAFAGATGRALACWQNPAAWRRMMRLAMQRDFSWREPMARYFEAYDTTGAAS